MSYQVEFFISFRLPLIFQLRYQFPAIFSAFFKPVEILLDIPGTTIKFDYKN